MLTVGEALALAEAMLLLMLAAPALRLLPLRLIGRVASLPIRAGIADAAIRRRIVRMVVLAVERSAKRSPLRALCFEQGLVAQLMLRRRGVDSTLFYGVAPVPDGGIEAHVWVVVGTVDVAGGEAARTFAPLASFPAGRRMPARLERP